MTPSRSLVLMVIYGVLHTAAELTLPIPSGGNFTQGKNSIIRIAQGISSASSALSPSQRYMALASRAWLRTPGIGVSGLAGPY